MIPEFLAHPATPVQEMSPERQAQLDELYWNSTLTITTIAQQFGLSPQRVSKSVTPLAVGQDCWWCAQPLVFRTRSERTEAAEERRYRRLICRCGVRQFFHRERLGRVPCPATILVPATKEVAPHDIADIVEMGIDALGACGLAWSGSFLQVDPSRGPSGLREVLDDLPDRFIVVPSLRHLGTNEGDSLAMFYRLVHDGWRIVTSTSIHAEASRYRYIGRHWSEPDWHDGFAALWGAEGSPDAPAPLRIVT